MEFPEDPNKLQDNHFYKNKEDGKTYFLKGSRFLEPGDPGYPANAEDGPEEDLEDN
jgi:hypothetical protein